MSYDIVILTSTFEVGSSQKGVGYRYWDLANSLSDRGVRVALVTPTESDFVPGDVDILDRSKMRSTDIQKLSKTFVFCLLEDEKLLSDLRGKSTLVYDSILTSVEELTFQSVLDYESKTDVNDHFKDSMRKHRLFNRIADYYLVGSEEEKLLKIGELLSEGHVTAASQLSVPAQLITMPVCGYSKRAVVHSSSGSASNTMLWNGGLWNHYSYDAIVDAVKHIALSEISIKLRFMYGNQTDAYKSLSSRIKKERLGCISLPMSGEEPLDYYNKIDVLNDCRALLLLNEHTLLSEMVLPMRLREAILFNKPLIVSNNGRLGAFVEAHKIGITCGNDERSLRSAMEVMLTDDTLYASFKQNLELMEEKFLFDNYLEPIVAAIAKGKA